jgi:hypothetical protein
VLDGGQTVEDKRPGNIEGMHEAFCDDAGVTGVCVSEDAFNQRGELDEVRGGLYA